MKHIKNFKLFEAIVDGEWEETHAELYKSEREDKENYLKIRKSILGNNIEEFIGVISTEPSNDVLKNALSLSIEYGLCDFTEYLLDNIEYSDNDIKKSVDFIKHSRKNPEGAIECLKLVKDKTGVDVGEYDIETSEYTPKPLDSDNGKDYSRVNKSIRRR